MAKALEISQRGVELALELRERYQTKQPLLVQGKSDKLLMPEHLLNRDIDLAAAEAITGIDRLLEVIVAPKFQEDALKLLRARWKKCWSGGALRFAVGP